MALQARQRKETGENAEIPALRIGDLLGQRTVLELRKLAAEFSLKGSSKLRKDALVQTLREGLLQKERLKEILYILESAEWTIFQRAASADGGAVLRAGPGPCQHLKQLGYLSTSRQGDNVICIVPEEVKAIYRELRHEGFCAYKARGDLIHTYAMAAVNLYGVIKIYDLIAIFNGQNSRQLTEGELLSTLRRRIAHDCGYLLWKEYLVHDAFEENAYRDVPDLLSMIGMKPRYVPDKTELLRYADPDYYEPTPSAMLMKHYLMEDVGLNQEVSEGILSELHYAIVLEAKANTLLDLLRDYGLDVPGDHRKILLDILSSMISSTRLWSNNGYTLDELLDLYSQKRCSKLPSKAEKIGRNDPCPCGSGKKYKKCCGR